MFFPDIFWKSIPGATLTSLRQASAAKSAQSAKAA
jgi:hypothetical protein